MTSTSQFTKSSPSFDTSPKHTTVPAHGTATVTSLLIIGDNVVTASDDHSIHVYSAKDASLLHELTGHSGGVWGLATHDDTLVSAGGDRTVRVWDLRTGECRHVFGEHTSTIRTVAIAYPDSVAGVDKPLIVSGSRDHMLKVWTLPSRDEESYQYTADEDNQRPNPYYRLDLRGHEGEVRDISVGGRQVASGSYDKSVRLWDILSGECVWTFHGHTEKGKYPNQLSPPPS
jgi:F-box and WD-40 domain protein CDC4